METLGTPLFDLHVGCRCFDAAPPGWRAPCHQGTAGYHYGYIWLNMAKTMDHIYIYIPQKTLSLSLPPFIAFRSPCPSCALKKLWHTIMATVYGGFVTVEGVPANHPKCCTI